MEVVITWQGNNTDHFMQKQKHFPFVLIFFFLVPRLLITATSNPVTFIHLKALNNL
jgi:hypothetical protein